MASQDISRKVSLTDATAPRISHTPITPPSSTTINIGSSPKLVARPLAPNGTISTPFDYDSGTGVFTPQEGTSVLQTFYSDSHLSHRFHDDSHITQMVVNFVPARRTYTTFAKFSTRFGTTNDVSSLSYNSFVPYSTPVTVDNTSIQNIWLVGYIVKGDPCGQWMRNACANSQPLTSHTHHQLNLYSDGSGPYLIENFLKDYQGEFYNSQQYTYTGKPLTTFSQRRGPCQAAGPPYTNVMSDDFWTDYTTALAAIRQGTNIHQSWPGMANGFDMGMFVTGYYARTMGELPFYYQLDGSMLPVVVPTTAFQLTYKWGDSLCEFAPIEFAASPGVNVIPVDIHVKKGYTLLIFPSLTPTNIWSTKRQNQPQTSSSAIQTLMYSDLYLNATSQNNLNTYRPHVVPSDSTLSIISPKNAYVPQASVAYFGECPGFWFLPNNQTIPICETGFTTMVCENPFYDGADLLYYLMKLIRGQTPNPPDPTKWSNGPSEILPSQAVPFFNVSLTYTS